MDASFVNDGCAIATRPRRGEPFGRPVCVPDLGFDRHERSPHWQWATSATDESKPLVRRQRGNHKWTSNHRQVGADPLSSLFGGPTGSDCGASD